MNEILDALQNVVMTEPEPETEVQPDQVQPDDGAIESQLTKQINSLWTEHTRLSTDRRVTSKELRQIRVVLAERLATMKSLLSRPGRGGLWRSWLRKRGIPRSTADGLVARYAETTSADDGNVPGRAISESDVAVAEKLASVAWSRYRKVLVSDEVVIDFVRRIAELAGVPHEWRAEGLVIFKPAPTAAEELPATAPAIDPAPQPSDEVPAIAKEPRDETAAAPPELGMAVAAAETGNGVAA
jgi:hypothetical protein